MSIASEVEAPGEATAGQVAELVRSVAQGDSRAWRKLVEQYEPLVRKITGRYRLNRDDANDVAQVVWLRLFQHISRIREPLALPGWIMTVTRNEALRVLMATASPHPSTRPATCGARRRTTPPGRRTSCCGASATGPRVPDLTLWHRISVNCSSCCTPISPMPKSAGACGSRSGASARLGPGAWKSCGKRQPFGVFRRTELAIRAESLSLTGNTSAICLADR